MRYRTRRLFFYTFVFIFAIVGPLLVAYSIGYTFNPSTAAFESTGGIFIKSPTPRLAVFLNGAFAKETGFITGSVLFTDLAPGRHLVRLEKERYGPWSKSALVEPTAVTELRNVMLIPYQPAIATSTPAELAALQATTSPAQSLTLERNGNLIAGRGKEAPVIAENVHSFTTVGDAIFFVSRSGFLGRYDLAGREIATIGRPGFFLTDTPLKFVSGRGLPGQAPAGQGLIGVIDSAGGFFLYEESSGALQPISSGVKEALLDAQAEKLLLHKDESIEIVWLKDNRHQPFQKKGTVEIIVKAAGAVREARWFYSTGAHVVYRTVLGIFFTEIDGRGGRNTAQLRTAAADELFTFPSLPNTIFYKEGSAAYRIEL